MNNYTYTYACRNIVKHNKDERTQYFRKNIPLTLLKGLCVRGSWRPNKDCNLLTHPQLFWISQPFFLVLLGCSAEGVVAQPLVGHGSHSSSSLQLTWTSCRRGYIIILAPSYFQRVSQFRTQFNPSTVNVTPDLLISSTGCTCYLHRYISFDSLAGSGVNMQKKKLQHYWIFIIRLFSVIFRTQFGGGVLLLSRDAVSVFSSFRAGWTQTLLVSTIFYRIP